MIDHTNRWRLASPVADVLVAPKHTAQLDTQILFGEEVIFLEYTENGFTKVRTSVDQKVGWVANAVLHFEKASTMRPTTHRIRVPRTFLFPSPSFKERPTGVLSMNALVTVSDTAIVAGREYAQIDHCMGGIGWVRTSALNALDRHEPDFVAVAESFIGSTYGWGKRDANPGIDCSAVLHASMLAVGRLSCPRDSGEQAKMIGEPVEINSLRELRRGDLVFLPGHVLIMTGPSLCVHATERDPYNQVLEQALSEVLSERRKAGDSCDFAVRRFPQYQRRQLRSAA